MLGWQRDGDAVVAVYSPEAGVRLEPGAGWSEISWWTVGGVELKEFRRDSSQAPLVRLPDSALFVEVPAGMLDSFGGPSPFIGEGLARRLLAWLWPIGQVIELLIIAALVHTTIVVTRRIRRRRLATAAAAPKT